MRLVLQLIILAVSYALSGSALAAEPASHYVRKSEGSDTAIVFVHGIIGDSIETWTNRNSYWPDMLAKDPAFTGADIFVYQYPTSMWATLSIDELAENMRLQITANMVSSHEKIVFIAHSMGGLVVSAYLLRNRDIASRTKLVYFFSTPTTGSEVASLAALISKNPQLSKMQSMRSADYLADLQRQWLSADFKIPSYCAYEKRPTYGLEVVTQASAASLCNKRLDPIDTNHIDIVKPSNQDDTPYLAFKVAFMEQTYNQNSPDDDLSRFLTSYDRRWVFDTKSGSIIEALGLNCRAYIRTQSEIGSYQYMLEADRRVPVPGKKGERVQVFIELDDRPTPETATGAGGSAGGRGDRRQRQISAMASFLSLLEHVDAVSA